MRVIIDGSHFFRRTGLGAIAEALEFKGEPLFIKENYSFLFCVIFTIAFR